MDNAYVGSVALALLYVLSVLGWGEILSRLFDLSLTTFWNILVGKLVFGLATLYALFIALSLAGRLHPLEVGIVIGLGVLLSCLGIPALFDSASKAVTGVKGWAGTDLGLLICAGFLAIVQLVFGLTPLMFYDLQVYHLLAPAQFLMSGGLGHIPWNVHSNSPLAIQLTVGMSLVLDASGQIAKLLFTLIGCLAAVGTYEFFRSSGRRAALVATLCVLCFPEFWVMQTLGVVDLAIAGLMVFGVIWARESVLEKRWTSAILAGLAFGMAVGSRYQAVILVVWLMSVVVGETCIAKRGFPGTRTIVRWAAIGGLVCLMVLPWLVRNYVHMGNPLFPLMQNVWGAGNEWSAPQDRMLRAEVLGPSLRGSAPIQMALAPFALLMILPSNGLFGLGLLLGSLIGLAIPRSPIRIASMLGLGGLIIWGLLRPEAGVPLLRFNALSLVFLLAATGAVLGSEWIPAGAGTRIALALAAGSFVIAMLHLHSIVPAAQSLVSSGVRQAIRQGNVPSWEAFDFVNENLNRQHDKILLLGETRAFWLKIPSIAPSAFNGPQLEAIFENSDSTVWQQRLSALGVTHLLISNPELERLHNKYGYLTLPADQANELNRWLQGLPKVFEDGRGTVILALARTSK